jgi:hypothetical protein
MEDKEANTAQVKENITKILDQELPRCVDNFVRGNCEFSGFRLGDIYVTKPDQDFVGMDSVSLFLVNEENMKMFALALRAYGDERREELLELLTQKKT